MSISEKWNSNASENQEAEFPPPLAMDDPQVAALVAGGHKEMAMRISYELSLLAGGMERRLDDLEEAVSRHEFTTGYDHESFKGFLRFVWKEFTGENQRNDAAEGERLYNAYANQVSDIENKRKALDPDHEPWGTAEGILLIEYPHVRLEYLREQADALPGMQGPVAKPASPVPGGIA